MLKLLIVENFTISCHLKMSYNKKKEVIANMIKYNFQNKLLTTYQLIDRCEKKFKKECNDINIIIREFAKNGIMIVKTITIIIPYEHNSMLKEE